MPGFPRLRESHDLVVVGGGHAGLQAAVKAALFRRTTALLDRGPKYSRSFYAPRLANIPGFPDEVSGHKLLDLQVAAVRRQEAWVGYFTPARATAAARTDTGFEVTFEWLKATHVARGRALLLAMGVVDRIPALNGDIKAIFPWANQGLVDFCLFCDGHELSGLRVAVIGHDAFAVRTALELAGWATASVTLLLHGRPLLEGVVEEEASALSTQLHEAKIPVVAGAMTGFGGLREKRFEVAFADGSTKAFDRGFSALGWYERNQALPRALGCAFDDDGYVVTDEDCRALSAETSEPIPGLYCVGDQRNGWNQIPEAWATAERAVIHAYAAYW